MTGTNGIYLRGGPGSQGRGTDGDDFRDFRPLRRGVQPVDNAVCPFD